MRGSHSTRPYRRAGAVCALVVSQLLTVGCPQTQRLVPSEIRGVWVADGGGYEGRVMEIQQQQITFHSGQGSSEAHPVVGVFSETRLGEEHYAVDYAMANGGQYRLHLIYEPSTDQLRLANRRQVAWSRQET